jgi:hypothetical protein
LELIEEDAAEAERWLRVDHPPAWNVLGPGRKAQQIVLNALAGKVKCSSCDTKFHDPQCRVRAARFPLGSFLEAEPLGRAPAIKVTRYIGHDSKNLTVDLTCNNCAHTGLYYFDGNPLLDAQALA